MSGAPSRADDSTASLRAGGLALEKTDKIALVSEDLYLSPTAVKVAYRFRNLTNADIETTVAFPMPDVTGSVDMTVAMPDPGHDNFLDFVTRVDGKPVNSQVEQRAFLTAPGKPDVEITERLKGLRVPLVPTMDAAGAALSALSEPQRKALADAEIVYADGSRRGQGRACGVGPALDAALEILAQSGLSGGAGPSCRADLHARDRQPVDLELRRAGPQRRASTAHYRETYCTDGPFTKSRPVPLPQGQRAQRTVGAFEEYLSYVITSGANWAGPIGTFRLVIDKGDTTLVSFCGDGVRKIGPTTFEMIAKDYTPKRDIDVLFIKTHSNR